MIISITTQIPIPLYIALTVLYVVLTFPFIDTMSSYGRGTRSDRSSFCTYIAECQTRHRVVLPRGGNVVLAKQWLTPYDGVIVVIKFLTTQPWAAARLVLSTIQPATIGDPLRFTIRPLGVQIPQLDQIVEESVIAHLDGKYEAPVMAENELDRMGDCFADNYNETIPVPIGMKRERTQEPKTPPHQVFAFNHALLPMTQVVPVSSGELTDIEE